MQPEELSVGKDGAQLFRAALSKTQLRDLENALATQPRGHAGVRLSGILELQRFLCPTGAVGQIPISILGPECFPATQ